MKFTDLIAQITAAIDPDEEITNVGEEEGQPNAAGPEEPQSGDGGADNSGDSMDALYEAINQYRSLLDEQQQHIDQLTTQISVLVKQGAAITDEVDRQVADELASGNPDLEDRARKLESARKGIYSLNLGKDED